MVDWAPRQSHSSLLSLKVVDSVRLSFPQCQGDGLQRSNAKWNAYIHHLIHKRRRRNYPSCRCNSITAGAPTTAREKLQRAESKVWAWSSIPYATLHHTSSLLPSLASNTTQDPVQGLISVSLFPFRRRRSRISIRNHWINTHPLVIFDRPVTVSLSPKQTKNKNNKKRTKTHKQKQNPRKTKTTKYSAWSTLIISNDSLK